MVRLTGVNDEPSKDWNLDEGLDALDEIGVKFVELRAVNGKNVDDLTDEVFDRVCARIQERGFVVTAYDSNLGKCELDEKNWEKEAQRLHLAIARANQLDVRLIRTMGFRRGACSVTEWYTMTLDWFARLTEIAESADKVMVLENCQLGNGSMGSHPKDCLEIMRRVGSPHLRMNLDPGNFAYAKEDPKQGYELLMDYVANVHVKDCKVPGDNRSFCLAGDGIACIRETLSALKAYGYEGCFTIEPHLRMYEGFHYSGKDDYVQAGRRVLELLEEAGFAVQLRP